MKSLVWVSVSSMIRFPPKCSIIALARPSASPLISVDGSDVSLMSFGAARVQESSRANGCCTSAAASAGQQLLIPDI